MNLCKTKRACAFFHIILTSGSHFERTSSEIFSDEKIRKAIFFGLRETEKSPGLKNHYPLAYELPVFTKRAQRELVVHPKFYYFDAGVYRYLRPRGPLDRSSEIEGAALEGLVGQHLRAWCQMQQDPYL